MPKRNAFRAALTRGERNERAADVVLEGIITSTISKLYMEGILRAKASLIPA
jgi:hypothetical protein